MSIKKEKSDLIMKRNEKSVYGSISLIKETAGIMDDTAAQTGINIF